MRLFLSYLILAISIIGVTGVKAEPLPQAKSGTAIAFRYAELMEKKALREEIFPRLRREWQPSVTMLLQVTGQSTLLDSNALLTRSIRHRFPYLDPLNHLQVELLKRHRDGEERAVRSIQLTINGVVAGLRNSG